jgi:hypothetical protein
VVAANSDKLLTLYSKDAKLKPTLSNFIRSNPENIKPYFDGTGNYNENGFLNNKFADVIFENSEPHLFDNIGYDMGIYKFTDPKGETSYAHYTFIFEKTIDGNILIKAQHSSLTI